MTSITLLRPFNHENKQYTEITIDEPTLGAIEAFEKAQAAGQGDMTATIALLSVDTGWPEGAIRKIRASDLKKISEALAPFV